MRQGQKAEAISVGMNKRSREACETSTTGEVTGSCREKEQLSADAILSAVANEHRRAILHALDDASEKTLDYDALVDDVADRVRDETTERAPDEQRRRVRIELHHTHLPKLEEPRIIDYEGDTGQVRFIGGDLEREILSVVETNQLQD